MMYSCNKYHSLQRVTLGVCVMKNSLSLDDSMSVDKFSGEWRVLGLFLMYGGGSLVCVSLCMSFSNGRGHGCRDTLWSGTDGWYLVRLTDLGWCGWK